MDKIFKPPFTLTRVSFSPLPPFFFLFYKEELNWKHGVFFFQGTYKHNANSKDWCVSVYI